MSHLPADHFVRIYRRRLRGLESMGSTCSEEAVTQVRDLLAGLERLDPSALIRLDHPKGKVAFVAVDDGRLVGSLDYLDSPEAEFDA
jgi:hypothetical protein